MIQEILILLLFLYICNNKNKNIEGVEDSPTYCDGMSSFLFDERCSSDHVYRVIKNCIGGEDKFSKDNDCKLCNGNKCYPTFEGGYCLNNNKKTDAYGEELRRVGRDLGDMTERELRNYDEDKYQEIKNECNPFTKSRERDEDEDYDEDEDNLDRIDRRSRSRHRRDRRRRRRKDTIPESESDPKTESSQSTNFLKQEIIDHEILIGVLLLLGLIIVIMILYRDTLIRKYESIKMKYS